MVVEFTEEKKRSLRKLLALTYFQIMDGELPADELGEVVEKKLKELMSSAIESVVIDGEEKTGHTVLIGFDNDDDDENYFFDEMYYGTLCDCHILRTLNLLVSEEDAIFFEETVKCYSKKNTAVYEDVGYEEVSREKVDFTMINHTDYVASLF